MLQAPAGHGKSTFLQQLRAVCEARGDVTGWLSIDDSDNDIHRFYEHLEAMIAGMQSRSDEIKIAEQLLDFGDGDFRADWLISQLLQIGKPSSIFLDDIHTINARQTLGLLRETVSHVPENIQIYLASRTLPDLGLARLTVTGEAVIVRAEDLCFNADETRRYFALDRKFSLQDDEISHIQKHTQGWPAALQLFKLALRNPAVRQDLRNLGRDRSIDLNAYLAEDVLLQQSPVSRDFLLRSSVLSRMSGQVCDEVLQTVDSEQQLLDLESTGLFVRRLDGTSRWFTYHPLFRSFLIDQLRLKNVEGSIILRRRAANWFLRNDYPEDALEHFLEAGDFAEAASVLDQWSHRLIPAAHMMTVARWSERIPLGELDQRPDLMVKVAWALTFLRRYSRLAPLVSIMERPAANSPYQAGDSRVVLAMVSILEDRLADAETIISGIDASRTGPSLFDAFQLGAVCNARGYAAMAAGNFAQAHEHLARSRLLSDPSEASFTWAYGLSLTGISLIAQGQLQEALILLKNCMQDPRMYVDESISQASIVAGYVMALYESDQLAEAEAQFLRFRDVIANAALHDHVAVSYVAMARIQDSLGHHSKALDLLDEAEAISYASRWPRIGEILVWERVRRELALGELDRAKAIAERAERIGLGATDRAGWVRYSEEVHGRTIGRLRLLAHFHDPQEALRAIAPVLSAARRQGRIYRQIKLLQIAALAQSRKQSGSNTHRYLEEALRLAAPGRYTRIFLEEGRAFHHILQTELASQLFTVELPHNAHLQPFIAELSRAAGMDPEARHPDSSSLRGVFQPAEQFTKKELRILELLAALVPPQEMAASLHVSKDGLKYHLKNIYSKLAVNNRTDAIRAAKQMGL